MSEVQRTNYFTIARQTFEIEKNALDRTLALLSEKAFTEACDLLLHCAGRVIVTGMGKSGHIARKIASTLSSTGTPAIFMHPTEAAHGDIGMVKNDDVLLMLSKSGDSDELFAILPSIVAVRAPIIAVTAQGDSKLAQAARDSGGVVLTITLEAEACPLDLAPTASTTASLVLGDALAMALLDARNFSAEDFAKLHPAGALGRRLTLRVADLMVKGDAIPTVWEETNLTKVMLEMSAKRIGATSVLHEGKVAGIITDGDLRRYFQAHPERNSFAVLARDIMSSNPRMVHSDALAIEALHLMEDLQPKVMHLLVVDDANLLCGLIHIHDIVRAGIS